MRAAVFGALAFFAVVIGAACIDFQGAIEDCQAQGGCVDDGAAADAGDGPGDSGSQDAGGDDAGEQDAGADAGEQDAGEEDAGVDAGEDAGEDAGTVDAGWCGGQWCLFSAGSSGQFEINPGVFATSPTRAFGVGWGNRLVRWNGTTWTAININPGGFGDDLRAVWGYDDKLFALAGNTAWHYFNGNDWQHEPYVTGLGSFKWLHGLADGGSIHAVTEGPSVAEFVGGQWQVVYDGGTSSIDALYGIWVNAADDIWAVGYDGLVLHKDGSGWNVVDAGVPADLYRVWADGPDDVWMVGQNGAVAHWNGSSFTRRNYFGSTLYGVFGTDAGEVYAVGAQGTFIRWNPDAGDWDLIPVQGTGNFLGVWAGGPNDLFMSGLPDGGYGVSHYKR